jgi:hypothetical protein
VRHTTNIYTPQMIVDGAEEFVGSDRTAALAAITRAAARPKPVLVVEWTPGSPAVHVTLAAGRDTSRADVFVALIEDGLHSSVRGENAGQPAQRHAASGLPVTGTDGSFPATVWLASISKKMRAARAEGGPSSRGRQVGIVAAAWLRREPLKPAHTGFTEFADGTARAFLARFTRNRGAGDGKGKTQGGRAGRRLASV